MAQFDTSIYSTRPKSVDEFTAIADDAEARKLAGQSNRLALMLQQRQVQAADAAAREQADLQAAMRGLGPKASDEDVVSLLKGRGAFDAANKYETGAIDRTAKRTNIDKDRASIEKEQLSTAKDRIGLLLNVIGGSRDQASYTQGINTLKANGMDVSTIPPQFDPAFVANAGQQALTAQQRLEQVWKAKNYDLDVRKFGETVRNNRAQNAISQGNLGVAQANLGVSRERLAMDKSAPKGVVNTDLGVVIDPRTGAAVPITVNGQPVAPKKPTEATAKATDAKEALAIIDQADELVGKATGSYGGAALDMIPRAFGASTAGATAAAQLKALEGILVSKMPKMSGPQSDKDVALYRQMAANIGDETVPAAQKQAALDTVREIQERYAGLPAGSTKRGRASSGRVSAPADGRPPLESFGGK